VLVNLKAIARLREYSSADAIEMDIGDVVVSRAFAGPAKIVSLDDGEGACTVEFFEGPSGANPRKIVSASDLSSYDFFEESQVYVFLPELNTYRRARYGGHRPNNKHLVIFRRGEDSVVEEIRLFILNLSNRDWIDCENFVLARVMDGSSTLFDTRLGFMQAYLKQKYISGGMPGLMASRIEVEPHQVGVVHRVLSSGRGKYLLADEVGLGKTIETGLLIVGHLQSRGNNSRVLISTPRAILEQWNDELDSRFFLGDLISVYPNDFDSTALIQIVAHDDAHEFYSIYPDPTLVVVDEAHLLVPKNFREAQTANAFTSHCTVLSNCEEGLILTGTPVGGNEQGYLGLMQFIEPGKFEFSDKGLSEFKYLLNLQDQIGGIYSALNRNSTKMALYRTVRALESQFPDDTVLVELATSSLSLFTPVSKAPEIEQFEALDRIREHIRSKYLILSKMIRNRREANGLGILFPGLEGLERIYFETQGKEYVEVILGKLIELIKNEDNDRYLIKRAIDLYFSSYSECLAEILKLDIIIEDLGFSRNDIERIFESENIAKIDAGLKFINTWLKDNDEGLLVVFIDNYDERLRLFEESKKAHSDRPVSLLDHIISQDIYELPTTGVLFGGRDMEDGLNLHGRSRAVLHYSVPIELQRIEQRMGRVNRYSANLKRVEPIKSYVIHPNLSGLYGYWLDILDNKIGIFETTVASLINVLEQSLFEMWESTCTVGVDEIVRWGEEVLGGNEGLVESERRRVRAVEEMMAIEDDLVESGGFSERIRDYEDEDAVNDGLKLNKWIQSGLIFDRVLVGESSFRYRYNYSEGVGEKQTLVDLESFINKCYFGMDNELFPDRVTLPMTLDREVSSTTRNVIPLRYGAPLVDSLWALLKSDPRGVLYGKIYVSEKATSFEPSLYIGINWLSDRELLSTNYSSLRNDKCPYETVWFDESGSTGATFEELGGPPDYHHYNAHHLTPELWADLNDYIPIAVWESFVREAFVATKNYLVTGTNASDPVPLSVELRLIVNV